jgi:anti-anti-sigma regulatory factor
LLPISRSVSREVGSQPPRRQRTDRRGAIVVKSKTACEAQPSPCRQRGQEGRARRGGVVAGSVSVRPQNADGAWLVALEGEHDLSTAALLEQATIGLWQRCTLAVVDLSGAAFIDTSVINWLMSAKRLVEASGSGTLGIVEGPPASFAARLFGLLSLRDVLACYPTRQDALTEVRAPTALAPWAEP